MASRKMATATSRFVRGLGEVSEKNAPLVTALTLLAAELDEKWNSTAYREYRITLRQLTESRADGESERDPLEMLLDG